MTASAEIVESEPTRPIKNCYTVVPGKLLAGEYPGAKERHVAIARIRAFLEAGVSVFIDLTTDADRLEPYSDLLESASCHRFPIRDYSTPDSPAQTTAILDAIDEHIRAGRLVYVHCRGGIGRTGLIVGCWLARHGESGPAALGRLRELWKENPKSAYCDSPETREQERYIMQWDEGA